MTEDPKNLPAWLRKDSENQAPKREPSRQPPPSDPPESDASDEESLPPWLREDAPPTDQPPSAEPTSGLRRLAPRPDEGDQGDVPPWLQGMDEPKSYSIGGAELSEEYLAGGDQLADSDNSELTFDLWMAQQTKSKREKDIEEEVPDLLSAIEDDKDKAAPPSTGQLPDWFLGLEELDTSDAPEWFNVDDKPSTGALGNEPPPWISDMVGEAAEPPADNSTKAPDDIASFFNSLAGSGATTPTAASADDEGEPDLDWLMGQQPLDTGDLPVDDFFAELSNQPPEAETPDWFSQPSNSPSAADPFADDPYAADPFAEEPDDFDDVDADAPTDDRGEPAVEIPQNELDAFFDNLAAGRAATQEDTDDIEEPDLGWFIDEAAAEPEAAEEAPADEFPDPEIFNEDDQNTLSWLNELGSIVSSASRSSEPYQPQQSPSFTDDIPDDVWSQPANDAAQDEFDWSSLPDSAEPSAEVAPEEDWLSGITPDEDVETEQSNEADTLPLVPTGLLSYREAQANPTPAEPEPEAVADDEAADFAPEPEQTDDLIPTDELNSGWLTDDLLAEAEFSDDLTPPDQAAPVEDEADDEYLQALAQEDLFAESDSAAPADDDFLSALRSDVEADDQARTPVTPADDDLFEQWDDQPEADAPEFEPPSTNELYAALGMSADEAKAPPEDEGAVPDLFGQWDDQPAAEQGAETEYNLYGDAPTDEQPEDEGAVPDDLFGQWDEQSEAEQGGETSTTCTGCATRAAGEEAQFDDVGQGRRRRADEYNLYGDAPTDEQPEDEGAVPDDLFGQWDDQPAAEQGDETEYNLYGDAPTDEQPEDEGAVPDDLFGQWDEQSEAEQGAETEYNLYGDAPTDEQPEDEGAVPDDLFGQWDDQPAAEQGDETEYNLYGDAPTDEQPEDEGAVPDDLFGQWDDQPAKRSKAPKPSTTCTEMRRPTSSRKTKARFLTICLVSGTISQRRS